MKVQTDFVIRALLIAFSLSSFSALATETKVKLAEGVDVTATDEPHRLTLLNDGPAALEMRLRLIQQATQSILIAPHTFDPDRAGRLVLQALAERVRQARKAREPFQACILIDGVGVNGHPGLDPQRLRELAKAGIQVRYFRPVRFDLALLLQGTHRKLFIKDSDAFIIGGRNIGDKYYEIQTGRNAVDRELLVEGAITAQARAAFFEFWDNKLSSTKEAMLDKFEDIKNAIEDKTTAEDPVLSVTDWDKANLAEVSRIGDIQLAANEPSFTTSTIRFLSDGPSGTAHSRVVTPAINSWLKGATNALIGEQLYFLPLKDRQELFQGLAKRGVAIQVFTNSHDSSPDELSYLNFVFLNDLVRSTAIEGALHAGAAPERARPSWSSPNYMIHTKGWVRDGKDSWIGSYNMDSVSAEHNAESAVIIPDDVDLANAILADMKQRREADGIPFVPGAGSTEQYSPYAKGGDAKRIEEGLLLHLAELFIHEL